MFFSTEYFSPLGKLTLVADDYNLVGLWFANQQHFGAGIIDTAVPRDNHYVFDIIKSWLDKYFSGMQPDISDLPLSPIGTEFRRRVWHALGEIPYGNVVTYGDIATRVRCACPRAVGAAIGHNPISIIIPCHRVIGVDGKLTGYAAGIDTKIKLLKLEKYLQ